MKNPFKKRDKVSKGGPSGFVISLLFHGAIFFVAGLFVVFTVVNKGEPEFEAPPPIERPKMKLKKPKVKVQKSSQPKPSSRIVAKVKTKQMPEIQLPDLMGDGDGLLGGAGEGSGDFLDLPEFSQPTLFGDGQSAGNDLEVTFYNLNLTARGTTASMNPDAYQNTLLKFLDSGWDRKVLDKFYKSPTKRYATTIMIPMVTSEVGPNAFGEDMNYGFCWAAVYEGKIVHKDPITFRFWGASDDVLVVRVDEEVVLNACWPTDTLGKYKDWNTKAPINYQDYLGNQFRVGGDWITMEPGVPKRFQAIVGESPGGQFHAQLLVEVEGEEYELNHRGTELFPVFAMEPLSWALQDTILMNLMEGDANVTNVTTFFRDY
jgi:hypothetical protein